MIPRTTTPCTTPRTSLARFPGRVAAPLVLLLASTLAVTAGCSAQARNESCREKAEELRRAQNDNILDPFDIRRLRSQGCLDASVYG